ncbi:MAG: hypothetical protein ACE149_15775 [Armatimonadota bacterium]
MIGEAVGTTTLAPPEAKASVLITITTPGIPTAICRLGNSEEVVRGLTVRELIQRVISPNSLFSVGVPISQLQAESAAALAIGELLGADCCEVVMPGKGSASDQGVALDELARSVAREQVGSQGNRFLNINLEVRSAADAVAPAGPERRQVAPPSAVEMERPLPTVAPTSEIPPAVTISHGWPVSYSDSPQHCDDPLAEKSAPRVREAEVAGTLGEAASPIEASEPADVPAAAEAGSPADGPTEASAPPILTIVADAPAAKVEDQPRERKEYVRKSDWLRAQFLPEIEALDFSGLFVGNLGLGVREEKARRNVILADPARITEVLLRANGYRRTGEHAKALICYQELVDMDGSNADFRFLLGKTLVALGQKEDAVEAFLRAKELGHDGADKELSDLKRSGHRPKGGFGFFRFWKQ